MISRPMLAVALVLLSSTAACGAFHNSQAVSVNTQDAMLNSRWHANLASPSTLAGAVQMNGSASLAPSPDSSSTRITLNLANASPGGLHPWAVHYGQCGEGMDGGVFGAGDAYEPLKVDSDGHAAGTTMVTMQTPKTGRYFAVVYASVANPDMVIACGNLAPPTQ